MKLQATVAILTLLIVLSCNPRQEKSVSSFAPKVVEANGYVVPKDSTAEPKALPAGKPRILPVKNPQVILLNKSNVSPPYNSKVVLAGSAKVYTPGQHGISLAKKVPAVDRPFLAGIPEVTVAKDARTKDHNPQNFSSFGKLQGLKTSLIHDIFEDKTGNLWITSWANGASKYDGKSFTHFTAREGLAQNQLRGILQDKRGNIWFGTLNRGVCKYDGKYFTNYTVTEGLSSNWILSMYEDDRGDLWFGTLGGGVNRYDGESFTHFAVKEGLGSTIVCAIEEDKNGHLWFATYGAGGVKYDGKSFTQFTVKEGLRGDTVVGILKDKKGNLWISTTRGGVDVYDGNNFTHLTESENSGKNVMSVMCEDKNGNIWFAYGTGVIKYDGNTFIFLGEKEGLSNKPVWSVVEDKSGNIWFATGDGLFKYGGNNFSHYPVIDSLTQNSIMSILKDKRDNIWFGTLGGVSKYDGRMFTLFSNKHLPNSIVWDMLEDKSGNIWFGTYRGVSKYDGKRFTNFTENEGLGNDDVKAILEDKHGNIWFGASGGATRYDGKSFTYFTEKEGLRCNMVLSMLEDRSGNLWFGTYGEGVSKYDGKNFTRFTVNHGLGNNVVMSMLEDRSGDLWFATEGGVSNYDGKNFTHFTEKEGLSNNNVVSIMEDKIGNLWFGTDYGISKLDKDQLPSFRKRNTNEAKSGFWETNIFFKNYTYENGFSGIGVNARKTMVEDNQGNIWICANHHLTVFCPGRDIPDTIPPNIQLTGISLFSENIPWQNLMSSPNNSNSKIKDSGFVLGNGEFIHDYFFDDVSKWYGTPENLRLAYDNNNLTFQFVGVTLKSPKKVKYRYKLEGFDKNWSALTNRSEANYSNISPGEYIFKVKAMNGEGYWSDEYQYSFSIRPPWWKTWWAYTLFALLFASIIYALFRYRISKIQKEHEIKQKNVELEMRVLRAQMNPHFIFNSLNSINLFILKNNKLQASRYLSKFSRLVRLILNNSQESFIPLERELEALHLYLELESLRFEQRFNYKITVDDSFDTTLLKVPPLIIQPYAENAIWHGLMHKKDTGHLEIELYQQGEILFCKITDDGIGRKKAVEFKNNQTSVSESVGMRITADRIAILQDQKQNDTYISVTDLILPDGSPGGTEVLLRIPVLI